MIFNSFTYLLFLCIVVTLYYQLSLRGRHVLLFVASLTFYGFWRIEYVALLLTTITVDFICALRIAKTRNSHLRWRWLALSVSMNLGTLFYFKYSMFFLNNLNGLALFLGYNELATSWAILLPIGISFYVFQQIAYMVDVYRRRVAPVRDYLLYCAFVTFFPQLVAGPILRARELVTQLRERHVFCQKNITKGCWLIVNGIFLKCVLADNIAPFVDNGFTVSPYTLSATDVWILSILFGFQIYFDFSAYSHIAQGSARLMGIALPDNFNFPYFASSPRDFWHRWHISLSSWIRDYLYLPLCGLKPHDVSTGGLEVFDSNVSNQRRSLALVATWLIMGLWHGASWSFVLWGFWHAGLILIQRAFSRVRSQQFGSKLLSWTVRLLSIGAIMLAWVFFRAQSVQNALIMLKKCIEPNEYLAIDRIQKGSIWSAVRINIDPMAYLAAVYCAVGMIVLYWFCIRMLPLIVENDKLRIFFTSIYGIIITATVLVYLRPAQQFIYFQF